MKENRTPTLFDCVAFKRKAQARIYRETKNMTLEEQIARYERQAEEGPLGEWWKRVKSANKRASARRPSA
jgi:hypothetical protein